MAKAKRKNSPAETNRVSGFVIQPETSGVVVRVPVKFYRRNGRQTILAKEDASGTNHQAAPAPNNALAANLAKAWRWQEQLESGEYSSIGELAAAYKIDISYMRRMLNLNSLAPDIVETILKNDTPDHISLRTLFRGISLSWAEQRLQLVGN
jgi:hypothetical protein